MVSYLHLAQFSHLTFEVSFRSLWRVSYSSEWHFLSLNEENWSSRYIHLRGGDYSGI